MRAGAALASLAVVWACNEQSLAPGIARDLSPPTVQISRASAADTVDISEGLDFQVVASDNLALRTVSVSVTGGVTRGIDTTFAGSVTPQVTIPISQTFGEGSTVGGWVFVQASATDGAGNASGVVLDSLYLFNVNALIVTVDRPNVGATSAPGKSLPVQVTGSQRDGVAFVGYFTSGVFEVRDSTAQIIGELPPEQTFSGTLRIPDSSPLGILTIRGFGIDALGRRVESAPRNIEILSTANDTTAPEVTFTVNDRVEVDDSITVRGTDPNGISELGWVATRLSDGTVVGQNSQTFGGDSTDVEFTWSLNLDPAAAGASIEIDAYAIDAVGNDSRDAPAPSSPAGSGPAGAFGASQVVGTNQKGLLPRELSVETVLVTRTFGISSLMQEASGEVRRSMPVPLAGARPGKEEALNEEAE
jgi:hypothetical protein